MLTSDSLKLFTILCRTFSTVSSIAKQDIKNYGLSLSEFGSLELLYHKGPQKIQEIGKKVLLTSGSLTYVIDQLVKKDLVQRKVCDIDRRITYVEISTRGNELMKDIFPQHQQCIDSLFSSLTSEEINALSDTLKQLSKSIQKGAST